MNLCSSCGEDFGSVEAFDLHRVGTHDYTYSEGVSLQPMREDGRRCLWRSELKHLAHSDGSAVFCRNRKGLWSLSRSLQKARKL